MASSLCIRLFCLCLYLLSVGFGSVFQLTTDCKLVSFTVHLSFTPPFFICMQPWSSFCPLSKQIIKYSELQVIILYPSYQSVVKGIFCTLHLFTFTWKRSKTLYLKVSIAWSWYHILQCTIIKIQYCHVNVCWYVIPKHLSFKGLSLK